MRKIFLAFLLALFCVNITEAQTLLYDFNTLTTGNLNGQSGWVTTQYPTPTAGDAQVAASQGFDLTNALFYNISGSGYGVDASKALPAGFFSDLTANYKISFETSPGVWGINAGIGYDVNLDGKITSADNNEKSIVYNTTSSAVSATIFGTVPVTVPTTYTGNWVRIEMFISQLSTGGKITIREFNLVTSTWRTILNNVNLNVTTAADNTNPANWNMIFTHMEGAPCVIDNIKFEKNPPYSTVAITGDTTLCTGVSTLLTANATAFNFFGSTPFFNGTSYAIPDNNPTGVMSPITVASSTLLASQVKSVTINSLPHTWDSDLTLYLIAPDGSNIILAQYVGSAGDNFTNTVFIPTALTPIASGAAPFTGQYIPQQPFTLLTGTAQGTWNLKVVDDASGDVGSINGWTLEIPNPNTIINYTWSTGETGPTTSTINYIPTVNATVSVSVTDASGYVATDDIYLVVTTSPTVSISGTAALCAGQSTVLLANAIAYSDTLKSTTTPFSIPDNNATGIQSPISVNSSAMASDIIFVSIDSLPHTWDGDLLISLIAPNGSSIILSANRGASGDNFMGTIFSATASTPIGSGSAPFTGQYIPDQAFSGLTGSANGTWFMKVVDMAGGDAGILKGWTIKLPQTNSITNYTWSTGDTTTQITNSPSSTTIFSVTVADANGCNATNQINVVVTPLPANPVVLNSNICSGAMDTITASGPVGPYKWWNDAIAGTLLGTGTEFITPALTGTTTYWVNAPAIAFPDTISTTFAGGNGSNGNMFDLSAINDIKIDSFDVNVYPGSNVILVYYKSGTYVGFDANPAAWTLLGTDTVVSTGSALPTRVQIGGLSIPAGQTYGLYVTTNGMSNNNYTNGTSTISDANITLNLGVGLAYPFAGTYSPRIWNGNIYYSKPGVCDGNRVPVTVVVNPMPTITLTSTSAVSICQGDSTNLTMSITGISPWVMVGDDGSGPVNFNISSSPFGTYVSPSTNTNYSIVSISDPIGCTTFSTDSIVVTVNTPAAVTVVDNGSVLTSSATTGNQWYEQTGGIISGATNQNYTPTVNGYYYSIVTDVNGCISISDTIHYVSVSINEIAQNTNVTISPNPSNGMFTIAVSTEKVEQMNLELRNIHGQIVFAKQIKVDSNYKESFDFSNLAKGVYYLRLNNETSSKINKVVIN